jgi:hypothetical protein
MKSAAYLYPEPVFIPEKKVWLEAVRLESLLGLCPCGRSHTQAN